MNEEYLQDEIEETNLEQNYDTDFDTDEVDAEPSEDTEDLYYEEEKPTNAHAMAYARLKKGAYIDKGYTLADAELKASKEFEDVLYKDTPENTRLMEKYTKELDKLQRSYNIDGFEAQLVAIMHAEQTNGAEAVKILQKEIEDAPPAPKEIKKLSPEDRKTFLDMKAIHPDYTVQRFLKTKKFLDRG